MMKKVFAILFLTSYLLSTTELHQLLKVPSLFEHYLEHKTKNQNITFADFIYLHYSQESDNDGDTSKDMKLPFKSHSCSVFSVNFVPLTEVQCSSLYTFLEITTRKSVNNNYTFLVSSSHLKAIWQPPQIC